MNKDVGGPLPTSSNIFNPLKINVSFKGFFLGCGEGCGDLVAKAHSHWNLEYEETTHTIQVKKLSQDVNHKYFGVIDHLKRKQLQF